MRIKALVILSSSILLYFLLVPTPSFALQMSDILPVGSNASVEAQVRAAFVSTPVMIAIAQCESGFRQFGSDGQVLRGGALSVPIPPLSGGGASVLGIFQISEAHTAKAAALGFDIKTIEGNIAYANILYQQQGITPWMAAFACFNQIASLSSAATLSPLPPLSASAISAVLTTDLVFGIDHPEVKVLQQLLNRIGFQVAARGLGSPGNEITSFGNLTRAAVRKFQCAKGIACSGDEHVSGYGLVNSATRTALLALVPPDFSVPSAIAVPSPSPTSFLLVRDLQIGMQGEDVFYLQNFLKQQGLFSLEPTGTFGPKTQAAVIAFQKKQAISPAAGYVGPKTQVAIRQLIGS